MPGTDLLPAHPPADLPCESDRGEWGQICPVCGRRLPPRPDALRSWHAGRALDRVRSQQARVSLHSPLRHWHL